MKSENGNNSNDECTTKFTDVKTGEVMPVDKNLLIVEFGKPSKLLGGIEGFNNTTLTRYLRMKVWTLLQCALLAGGVLPNDDYTEVPEFAMGLQNKWLGEGDFQLREARRILIDLRGDAMPDEISPTDFFAWLKARPDPEFHALRWLSAIEELNSEAITVVGTVEIKEQQDAPQSQIIPDRNIEKAGPIPVTTGDIAFAFSGAHGWNEKQWKKPLGDKPKWLKACIAIPGARGVRETRWNPVLIGAALVNSGHAKPQSIRARFQKKPQLNPWLDAWNTYEIEHFATE